MNSKWFGLYLIFGLILCSCKSGVPLEIDKKNQQKDSLLTPLSANQNYPHQTSTMITELVTILPTNHFCYKPIDQRAIIKLTDNILKNKYDEWLKSQSEFDLEQAIAFVLRTERTYLSFKVAKCPSNPNELLAAHYTHCVGFSSFFAASMDYILNQTNNAKRYTVKHLVGKVHFLNVDLHQFTTDPFWTDHDFNVVIDNVHHKEIYIDASLYDFTNKPFVNKCD